MGAGYGSQDNPYIEFPFDRIVEVHWKKKAPTMGTTGFSPSQGYTHVLGWQSAAFAFALRYNTGELAYDFTAGIIHSTSLGMISGTYSATLYSAGSVGHKSGGGTVQFGMQDTGSGAFLWMSQAMSTAPGADTSFSFSVGPFAMPVSFAIQVVFQTLAAYGDEFGTGTGTSGTDPGFDLILS